MKLALVQFSPWDKKYSFSIGGLKSKLNDEVIVETELGLELGKVVGFNELEKDKDKTEGGETIKPILRLATLEDYQKLPKPEVKKEALAFCQELILKYELPMKLVDVHFSLAGNRMNFAFAAESRVDFRQLVKDLTTHFGAFIRLTQIGSRDEAKANGDCGHCGLGLCCRGCLKDFCSITSEMAEAQQVVHRGSERISGMCGRLMCCLAYEYDGYKEMGSKMPAVGAKVNVDGKRGEVVNRHILKQSVNVKFAGDKGDDYSIVEVDLNRHKKK